MVWQYCHAQFHTASSELLQKISIIPLRPFQRIPIEKGMLGKRFSIIGDIFNEFRRELNAFTKKVWGWREVSAFAIPHVAFDGAFRKIERYLARNHAKYPYWEGGSLRNVSRQSGGGI